eukprot:1925451-Amphidinium_carterae.1
MTPGRSAHSALKHPPLDEDGAGTSTSVGDIATGNAGGARPSTTVGDITADQQVGALPPELSQELIRTSEERVLEAEFRKGEHKPQWMHSTSFG